ncbi:MAG: MarR family winged helix-turn-helix transcriptional regulator [Steroidobacteraceae bacterium]
MADARASNLLGAFLTGLHDRMNSRIERQSGLSGDDPAALVAIAYNEGRTVEFLRNTLTLSHSWTVRVVAKLEKAGLVNKKTGVDKRTVALFLTARGKRKVQGIVRARRRCLDEVLAVLPVKDQEKLTPMLEQMLAFLTDDFYSAEAICKLCEVDVCPQKRCPVTLAVKPGQAGLPSG